MADEQPCQDCGETHGTIEEEKQLVYEKILSLTETLWKLRTGAGLCGILVVAFGHLVWPWLGAFLLACYMGHLVLINLTGVDGSIRYLKQLSSQTANLKTPVQGAGKHPGQGQYL